MDSSSEDERLDAMIDAALKDDEEDPPAIEEEPPETGVDSDGEDPVERKEYEMELAIADYVEDPLVRHNLYPDSDSDEEAREREGNRESAYMRKPEGSLYKGQSFFNGIAFKEAVLDYALANQRNIRQYRYDKTSLGFACLGKGKGGCKCPWRVYCSVRRSGTWVIKVYVEKHSCEKSGTCKLLKVSAIARIFLDQIRARPDDCMPAFIEDAIFEKWGISVTRNQVQSARKKALKWIEAEYDEQFKRLRDYGNEILVSNPGSTVDIECLRNSDGEDVFYRFYVCFSALKRSWKANCRPLLGIDGSFLKSKVKGQLLVALGRDADNRIYPVAWGVVGVENTDNWVWFVKKIKSDLELGDGEGHVIVSDRQKGLIKAVSTELPQIEHRHCVRHIYGNLKAKHGTKGIMKPFIWNLAWSYNEAEYTENLEELRKFDSNVYEDVMKTNPKSWCRAFYKLGPHCEDVENNSTESFNKSVVKARAMAFVPMLETIRRLAMVRISKRNILTEKHDGILSPYASEVLTSEEKSAKECKVKPSTNGYYDVVVSGCGHRVNLEKKTCTCRKFQITGIPCAHAYGVILHRQLYVEEFVSGWFHSIIWKRTYEEGIVPLRGARFWPRGTLPVKLPTYADKKATKEESKRKRGKNESPTKKKPKELKRVMHCGICGASGHNCRYHKENKGKGKQPNEKGTQTKSKGSQKNVLVSAKKSKGSEKNAKGSEKEAQGSASQSSQFHMPD